ncbi:MAG: YraN family protein [Nannocystis sp.]|uniref:YraN family protein n=1 Tax=Nannocystis sp. TaxID=1962667 RepID=UPI002421D4FF|nr:YraN family protein [Nannocystis sp.]MBK9756929.1 YraN family protein [Nannocystis sp.]
MQPPVSPRARGRASEDLAASFLEARGLVVCDRNVTLAGAELDLVARIAGPPGAPDTLVFVEVRSRADALAGHPLETISLNKQRRLLRAATAWLVRASLWEQVEVRFDVVAIVFGDDKAPEITWIPGAFGTDG